MPVVVECECGKRFRAKDELAGRNVPCPGCGTVLTIPSPVESAAAPMARSKASTSLRPPESPAITRAGYPVGRTRPTQRQETPRFAISGKTAVYLSLFILIPTLLFLGKIGPMRAMEQMKVAEAEASIDVTDFVNRWLYDEKIKQGFSLSRAQDVPDVKGITVDSPAMMIRLPESVGVQGRSTEGVFRGRYFIKQRRWVGTIELDGTEVPVRAFKDANNLVKFE